MKNTVLNLFTILALLVIMIFCVVFAFIFINPQSSLNPLPPRELPEVLVLPTATATLRQLPTIDQPTEEFVFTMTQEMTLRPSSTPLPTFTSFVLPSATITLTPTSTVTLTPEASPTSELYQCQVLYKFPNGASLPSGGDFDGKWTVRNTGKEQWSDQFDWVFVSGDRFQVRSDLVDLTQYINPGNETDFIVDMLAPSQSGSYSAKWALRTSNNLYFCETEITLTVR
ncbi:MAG: NBR1-Ig-like domain-containing protein [Anaerolineaceae bacterium]|mgnify:FL=1|jgi:hypothetical protein|nr:NBR1-Ig-like domain-containing protein [Anaerolineaceae bacterium]